jgi:hypothetical protein
VINNNNSTGNIININAAHSLIHIIDIPAISCLVIGLGPSDRYSNWQFIFKFFYIFNRH